MVKVAFCRLMADDYNQSLNELARQVLIGDRSISTTGGGGGGGVKLVVRLAELRDRSGVLGEGVEARVGVRRGPSALGDP